MKENNNQNEFWNSAAGLGMMLGAVSVAYFAINSLMGKTDKPVTAILISVLGTILWIAKFSGCILLMKAGMKRYVKLNPEADSRDSFRLGVMSALFSALIYSGAYLLFVTVINPDMFSEAIQMATEQYSTLYPEVSGSMEKMAGKLPQYTFFANLAYCTVFGTVLSAILSRNIPSRNPFERQ